MTTGPQTTLPKPSGERLAFERVMPRSILLVVGSLVTEVEGLGVPAFAMASRVGGSVRSRTRRVPSFIRATDSMRRKLSPCCGGELGQAIDVLASHRGPQRRVNARLRIRKFETPGGRAASITAKAAGEVGWYSPGARIGPDGRLKWR